MRGKKPKPSKSFIFTHGKSNKESDAKNNFYRRGGDMHHLRCVNLFRIHAKGCDISAGFDFKRLPEVVCEGDGNRDW